MSSSRGVKCLFFLVVCTLTVSIKVQNLYAQGALFEDLPLEVSADVAINSKYIWRGITLDDDPVMQQGIYAVVEGFTASIWGSFDIDADDSLNSDEVDYAIDYTKEFENFSLSVGHTYYDFPAIDAASKEFYLGTGFDLPLSPSLTWYHDYGEEDSGGGDGDYLVLELSKSIPFADTPFNLDLSTHLGYNKELFIKDVGGDLALEAALTVSLTEKIAFSPNISYSIPFGDVEDLYNYELYGGFILELGF